MIEAPLDAARVEDLPMYIRAFAYDGEKLHARAGQALRDLLGRMTADELSDLSDQNWSMLCPVPRMTPTGYAAAQSAGGEDDEVRAAVFTAIAHAGRLKSLPYVESSFLLLDADCHSETYVRALVECYETLRNLRDAAADSNTLLRASSADVGVDVLLRPASGIHRADVERGEQLLRASIDASDAAH